MTETWNMALYCEDATYIVVNDCHPLKFGCAGEAYWCGVLGYQLSFSAWDRYLKIEELEWDLLCIWTCNPRLDPR